MLYTSEERIRTDLNRPGIAGDSDYGLVHDILSSLFPSDAQLAVTGEPIQVAQPAIIHVTAPTAQAFTRSLDLDVGTNFSGAA